MYTQEEDAGAEAVPVLGDKEVDVWEFRWWEEGCPGHLAFQDDGVGVEPAYQNGISISVQPVSEICP